MEIDEKAVENFKEYLRIPSVSPDCNYEDCVEFIKRIAEDVGLPAHVEMVAVDKPVVVASWQGSEPELSSLLLSSHMDVVPVFADMWTHEPFSAEEDQNGNIYARGAQDMKCVGIQYLEAIHRLILRGFQPKRTVHICFTPDEEVGSTDGMEKFVETDFFKNLNIGCVLDEGGSSSNDALFIFYGEMTRYPFTIICSGTPGHGSLLHDNTAGEKIAVVIDEVMAKRAELKKKRKEENLHDITVINMTKLEGGVQTNVVPPELRVTFDCRIHPDTDIDEFEKWIYSVCNDAGEGVSVVFPYAKDVIKSTQLNGENPWWMALKNRFELMGIKIVPRICPGGTDSRYLRKLGIPAFGFSPMNHTEPKPHGHDEYLNRKIFLKGIEIYMDIVSALACI